MEIRTSSDLPFSKTFSIDEFRSAIAEFDLIGSLMSLQRLGVLMGNQTAVNANIEFEFYASEKVQLRVGTLTRDLISFFSKEILLNCGSSNTQYNDLDLIRLIYIYGNLEIDLHKIARQSNVQKTGWLWVVRATNHQWCYLRFPSSIIARYHWIFVKLFENNAELGSKLNHILGIDIFDAMKIGTCIFANYCPRKDGIFADSFVMSSYTKTTVKGLKSLLTEENINKFLSIFSITPEQFRNECKKYELSDSALKKYEFNPLKRFPVIETTSLTENEKFIVPSLYDFIYGCFEGFYYVLLDGLKKDDKKLFLQGIGDVFEQYIGELMRYYNIDLLSRATLVPEISYKIGRLSWKSADWILVSDKYIIQIECKKRKIDTYSKAGIQNADNQGIDSLLGSLAKEMDKLVQKGEHLKQGKVVGVNYKGQEVINLMVYLDEMFALNEYARDEIKAKMTKGSDNFYVLGCWEFELMCQQSRNRQQSFYESIGDTANNTAAIYKIDFLDQIYRRFFKSLG